MMPFGHKKLREGENHAAYSPSGCSFSDCADDICFRFRSHRILAPERFVASGRSRILAGRVIGAALAIAAGYYDMGRATLAETHEFIHVHMKIGWILFSLFAGLTLWRWILSRKEVRIGSVYLTAAFLAVVLTLFQGWYGGELVYSQGAGVAAAGKGTEPPSAGYERLISVTNRLGVKAREHVHHEETDGEAHK